MTPITQTAMRAELEASFAEARQEWLRADNDPGEWTLRAALVSEARYAVDRYRPRERGILTDETDETISELATRLADAAMPEVMALAHQILATRTAAALGGRVYRATEW